MVGALNRLRYYLLAPQPTRPYRATWILGRALRSRVQTLLFSVHLLRMRWVLINMSCCYLIIVFIITNS